MNQLETKNNIFCSDENAVAFQIFELGPDGGENETDGELIAETGEIPYESGVR